MVMKFNIFLILIFLLIFLFVNGVGITYRAKNVETLVIFSFNGKINESEKQPVSSYIDYLNNLVTIRDADQTFFDQDKISFNLFFGNYDATSLLNAAGNNTIAFIILKNNQEFTLKSIVHENNTIAFIILKSNQEFTDNVIQEANDTSLSSATTCNETLHFCKVIHHFLDKPRDLLTKLNLVVISNICPNPSIFEEFNSYNRKRPKDRTEDRKTASTAYNRENDEDFTRTFLITKARQNNLQTCGIDKSILTKQFTLDTDYNKVDESDRKALIDPTFVQKIERDVEDHLLILVEKYNFNVSLKFISDFYNDKTKCDFEAPLNGYKKIKTYLITMRVKHNEIYRLFTTLIPSVNFNQANFTLEEYLVQNLYYNFKNSRISIAFDISMPLMLYDAQHLIIFTDDYSYLQKLNSGSLNKDNHTVDYILYMTSSDDRIVENLKNNFYTYDSAKAAFHIMTPENKKNVFGENTCQLITKAQKEGFGEIAVQFKLQLWHFILIGIGIFSTVVGFAVFYYKCIRPKNLYVEIMKNIPSGENKEELSKVCDEFYIPEGKFKINFNLVKGQGLSSTVYEATIKRALLSALPRRSFDHNSISEDYIVAAKLLNHLQQDQISQSDFYGEINAARKLGKHDKICTLLGWSAHLEAPCLLFELMEMDLYNYLLRLREPLSQSESENGSTIILPVTEFEHYGVPNFDEKQQKIFLQILWQSSQGLDYIASKNIVHRDVAARNVLISPYGNNETFTAKISDFGLCVDVDERTKEYKTTTTDKRLPLKLFAPECHFEHIFSEASDVWAFGLLMIEVYSLSGTLYHGIGMNKIPEYLKQGKRIEKPDKMPQDIYEISYSCWKDDPNLRKPFHKLSKDIKEKLRTIDPENDAYRDYWHLQIEDEELMESFIPRKLKPK